MKIQLMMLLINLKNKLKSYFKSIVRILREMIELTVQFYTFNHRFDTPYLLCYTIHIMNSIILTFHLESLTPYVYSGL